MENINLSNDPLRKSMFLIKTKDTGTNFINLFGALSDESLYFRKKSKLNGSAFLVGVNKIIEHLLCKLNINDLLGGYNHYMDLHVKLSNFNVRIKTWLQKDRIPLEFIRIISLVLVIDNSGN